MKPDPVELSFLLWERINQPRRARARLVNRFEPLLCPLEKPQSVRRAANDDAPAPAAG